MTLNEIKRVWIDGNAIYLETNNGEIVNEQFQNYKRLRNATTQQRENYKINDFGIYWPDIDEDLSFDGFFKKSENEISKLIKGNPIINASALARRLNIPQSLFAAYVSGTKNPSMERIKAIKEEIKKIGHELESVG